MKEIKSLIGYSLWIVALFVLVIAGAADTWQHSIMIVVGAVVLAGLASVLAED
jgi:hypothetical protein